MGNVPPSAANGGDSTPPLTCAGGPQSSNQQPPVDTNNPPTTSSTLSTNNNYVKSTCACNKCPSVSSTHDNDKIVNCSTSESDSGAVPPVAASIPPVAASINAASGICNDVSQNKNNINLTSSSAQNNNIHDAVPNAQTAASSYTNPSAAALSYTNPSAVDTLLYPTAYPTKTIMLTKELMSLDGDDNINCLVRSGFKKELVCSLLATHNYTPGERLREDEWLAIMIDITAAKSMDDAKHNSSEYIMEDAEPTTSKCNTLQSPQSPSNTNDNINTTEKNNDTLGGITDGVSKLRSPSGTLHSPMKDPIHNNNKRLKKRNECDDTSTHTTSNNTNNNADNSMDMCGIIAPQINRTATTQSTSPFIKPENDSVAAFGATDAQLQHINQNMDQYVSDIKPERAEPKNWRTWHYESSWSGSSGNGRGSSRSKNNSQQNNKQNYATSNNNTVSTMGTNRRSNTESTSVQAGSTNLNHHSLGTSSVAASTSTNTNSNYSHPHTLSSLLWSGNNTTAVNINSQAQAQPQLNCYGQAGGGIEEDESNMYDIGDETALDQILHRLDHVDEAEQLLGYNISDPEDLLQLLQERETLDWIPEGIDRPFQDKNWLLSRNESKQLFGPKVKIGNRQPLSDAESKLIFGPYGIARKLFPIYSHKNRRYGETLAGGKTVEDLQGLACPCKGCNVAVKVARVNGGIVVYEKIDPATGKSYTHNTSAHKNHPMDKNSTSISLSFEQKEFVLKRLGKDPCSAICSDMLSDQSITKTVEQMEDSKELTATISYYMSRDSTKGKYLLHDWRREDFSGAETNAILESLKESPGLFEKADFMESDYYQSMKKRINIIEHSYGPCGDKKLVLFETKDIAKRIELAGLMFDHGAVQISCDFADIPGTNMQLGTCGVDDFGRKQYLTSFCICPYENAADAEKLMKATVDRIDADIRAKRDKALIDGAGALKKAARALLLRVRSCHAHIVRLALRRGGGKRGSKGSLSRYLLTNMGMCHKDMAKVVGDVHYGNYIPPKYHEDYVAFNDLLWHRHDDKLHLRNSTKKSDEEKKKHVNHLKKTYLSPDPCCSGGRAVGIEGQSGSNQGGEKRGGQIKAYHKRITGRLSREAKKSVIFIVAAVAMDLELDSNLSKFRTKPERSKEDYNHSRKISQYNLDESNSNLMCDVQHMICTKLGDHKEVIDTRDVIGDEKKSFTVNIPTGSLVYSMVSAMESENNNNSSKSFLEQPIPESEVADTPYKCSKILDKMSKEGSKSLMLRLRRNLFENTPGRKDGEDLFRFVQRRAQRNPSSGSTVRTAARIKQKRKWKQGLTDKEKEKERHKWGDFCPDPDDVDDTNVGSVGEKVDSNGGENDLFMYWTDEMDWSDLLSFLQANDVDVGNDATLKSIDEAANRVRLPRQLGDWIEVDINANTKRIKCNCEDFNTEGACYHQCTFEVLQFKIYPNQRCQKGEESWLNIRNKCIEVLKKTFIQV